jgi:hypothetical protein
MGYWPRCEIAENGQGLAPWRRGGSAGQNSGKLVARAEGGMVQDDTNDSGLRFGALE